MNWCRVCKRKTNETGRCSSCATTLTPWYEPKQVHKCPNCRGNHTSAREDGARFCRDCGAEFEPVEVGYLDTRPVENAEKRESERRGRR